MMKLLSSVFDFAGHYQVITGFRLFIFSGVAVQEGTQALEYFTRCFQHLGSTVIVD